jgi:UDP-N-acetylmuramoyl-L-alanyl-D-glutamate--2,6-diaminopimelate ligase
VEILKDILEKSGTLEIIGSVDRKCSAICSGSHDVIPDAIFVAIKGTKTDGHNFISEAIEKGATVIVCEKFPDIINKEITYVKVSNSNFALGQIASNFFDSPSSNLRLIGVTGTNGKTTIATLLFNLFRELGHKVGLFSTVCNRIHDEILPATHTTPDPVKLNELLKRMVMAGCNYCFMEVSSHAVVQNRIAGLEYYAGIFTNLTHDHLDYHKTFDNYLTAKKGFFDSLSKSAFALVNIDDRNGEVMVQNTKAKIYTYSMKAMADFRCQILENQFSGLQLSIDNKEAWFKLVGEFNAYNLLAIYATAVLVGEDKIEVLRLLSGIEAVEGRFDYITSPDGIIAIVDYAHTPDALKNVLSTIGVIRQGNEKIITVCGAGGDRDATKRPVMAKIACELSDKVILTSDNPRSEDPEIILNDMQKGIDPVGARKVLTITNRKEAIRTACTLAQKGDIILVAGKGHEKYQEIKGIKYPFDDKEILREFLFGESHN